MFFVWVVSDYGSEILGCSLNAQFLPSWGAEIEQDTSILAYFCFCLSFLHLPSFFLHVHYFFHSLLCKIDLFFVLTGDPRNLPLPASCRNLRQQFSHQIRTSHCAVAFLPGWWLLGFIGSQVLWIFSSLAEFWYYAAGCIYQAILMIKHFHKLTHSDPYVHADKACKSSGFYLFFKDLISSL